MDKKTTMYKIGKNQYRVNYWSDYYKMYTDMDNIFTYSQARQICKEDNKK
jgi:hypothetical protein